MTLKQIRLYFENIPYVDPNSKEFGKPPRIELPAVGLTRYAERCSVTVPFDVHLDLIRNGEE